MGTTDKPKLTREQVNALRDFERRNGRYWKSKLHDIWMTGDYGYEDDSASLQQIRNQFGPSWLVKFKFSSLPIRLDTIEITNGEWCEVSTILDFLEYMHEQSAPLPEDSEEADILLSRYIVRQRKLGMDRLRAEGKVL